MQLVLAAAAAAAANGEGDSNADFDGDDAAAASLAAAAAAEVASAQFWNGRILPTWELLLLLVAVYHLVTLPLRWAMPVERTPVLAWVIADYACDAVYLLDIFLRLAAFGYLDPKTSRFEIDRAKVRAHYWRTHALVDALSLLPLDALTLLPAVGWAHLPWLRANRLLRSVRVSALLRSLQFDLVQGGWVSGAPIGWRIVRLFLLLCVSAHWVASIFLCIGQSQCNTNALGWTVPANLLYKQNFGCWLVQDMGAKAATNSFATLYSRALLYALSSLITLCLTAVAPITNAEIVFTLAVVCWGAVLSTAIIGTFSAYFNQTDAEASAFDDRKETLRQFLEFKQVPRELMATVGSYMDYAQRTTGGAKEESVLELLPQHLRTEIKMSLEGGSLTRVPFFHGLPPVLSSALALALDSVILPPNHVLFRTGDASTDMYFLNDGAVRMRFESSASSSSSSSASSAAHAATAGGSVVTAPAFFGEQSLLGTRARTATAVTASFCEFTVLTRRRYLDVMTRMYPDPAVCAEQCDAIRDKMEAHHKRQAKLKFMLSEEPDASGAGKQGENGDDDEEEEDAPSCFNWGCGCCSSSSCGRTATDEDAMAAAPARRCLAPLSRFRANWQLLNVTLLLYILVALPLRIAFLSGGDASYLDDILWRRFGDWTSVAAAAPSFALVYQPALIWFGVDALCDLVFLADALLNAACFEFRAEPAPVALDTDLYDYDCWGVGRCYLLCFCVFTCPTKNLEIFHGFFPGFFCF